MTLEQIADLTASSHCHWPLAPQPAPSSQNNPAKEWPRLSNWCSKTLFWSYTCDGEIFFFKCPFPFPQKSNIHHFVTKSQGCFKSWPVAWQSKVQRYDTTHGLLALLWVNWVNYSQCSTHSRADMLGVSLHNAVIFSTSLLLTFVFKMGITAFPNFFTRILWKQINMLRCSDAEEIQWSMQGRRDGPTVDYKNRYCWSDWQDASESVLNAKHFKQIFIPVASQKTVSLDAKKADVHQEKFMQGHWPREMDTEAPRAIDKQGWAPLGFDKAQIPGRDDRIQVCLHG